MSITSSRVEPGETSPAKASPEEIWEISDQWEEEAHHQQEDEEEEKVFMTENSLNLSEQADEEEESEEF